MQAKIIAIEFIESEIDINDLNSDTWKNVPETLVSTYWSGAEAPSGSHFSFKLLWSAGFLYVHFAANSNEPLIVKERPKTARKTLGLWDRDVCEIYVAPDGAEPKKYFEFEAAPTGEWVDLAIEQTVNGRQTDVEYFSGMEAAAQIEGRQILIAMRIPFSAFGKIPLTGDVWLGNLFRCVGRDPNRGYLAWSPTFTSQPNFHVPEAFGQFRFVGSEKRHGLETKSQSPSTVSTIY